MAEKHIPLMLDNIAKKRYNEKPFRYLTHKQKNDCIIYYNQLVKIDKEKKEMALTKAHVLKTLQWAVIFLLAMTVVMLVFFNR
tara:strand:- start:1933 stop:2181 length:249 start_codon:yes stop_codon:yes gene_type:complete